MTNPADTLRDLANLQEAKDAEYGADWRKFGARMAAFFPEGVTLEAPEDFGRFALLVHIVGKIGRYCANFDRTEGHPDSLKDLAVYATMLEALDARTP